MSSLQNVVLDPDLICRYDRPGPRYTSYPTAVQFHSGFGETQYRAAAERSGAAYGRATSGRVPAPRPLSLYFHIPFCSTVCFYCACNKIITKNRARALPYLQALHREIALQGELLGGERVVEQLHWGGGTPTFISHAEMRELMAVTRRHFRLRPDDRGEYSIEIDPREVRAGTLGVLRELGFNRLSMGVQDFDPIVQKAVNRIQSEQQTLAVLEEARRLGFRSINMDLIYGLPKQTPAGFAGTLEKVIAANPERLSVFNYAHLPELFKSQRHIHSDELPGAQAKLEILQLTIATLTDAGYVYIGMDHFARPDDELAIAQRDGTLYRNFQGYSTHADCDLVGLGLTAIGKIGTSYGQNQKTMGAYTAAIAQGRLPILRGIELDGDDLLRREIITSLICRFRLDLAAIERNFDLAFQDYFSDELAELARMQADGLLRIEPNAIAVAPAGKLLIRNICMVFDKYLQPREPVRYSRAI